MSPYDLCAANSIGELPARCSLALVSDTFRFGIRHVGVDGCGIVNREDRAKGYGSPNAVIRVWIPQIISLMPFLFIVSSRTGRWPKPYRIHSVLQKFNILCLT